MLKGRGRSTKHSKAEDKRESGELEWIGCEFFSLHYKLYNFDP
jgi:hypothetical protein